MSRDHSLLKLRKIEAGLRKKLAGVALIGQLSSARTNYLRLVAEVKTLVAGKDEGLADVPDCVLLALMVFCARYEDTSAEGFWAVFLRRIGLSNTPRAQAACRERFKEAKESLCRSHSHLYFPAEGYSCVTPILYHAIIPQACVPEMAELLSGISHGAGWDAVSEMEMEQLEAQLPSIAHRAHATKTLTRFITGANTRRLATRMVHDLCDAAYLHQRQELSADQINYLLTDQPVQRELWERMMATPETTQPAVSAHSLLVAPRWQWDIQARKLRLFFPRQTLSNLSRPAWLTIKKERYPVQAEREGDGWWVEPISIANLPVMWPTPPSFSVELRDKSDHCLRQWRSVKPPESSELFFQLNPASKVATYVNPEKGLTPGEYLVLHRRDLRLCDEDGDVKPIYCERVPQGFEAAYDAVSVWLTPPVSVFSHNDDEWLRRYPLLSESLRTLRLDGRLLEVADDPSGAAVYLGEAPDLCVPAQSYEEVNKLQLQLRELTAATNAVAELRSAQSLVKSELATWSETEQLLRVHLGGLLLGRQGRFRVKLLYGLQSARYAPIEFVVTPEMQILPSNYDIERTLFTADEPPRTQVSCSEAAALTSTSGQVGAVMPGIYQIRWSPYSADFTARLDFDHFRVPLRWHFHVFRAKVLTKGFGKTYAEQPLILSFDDLSFDHLIQVECIEDAPYQIFADGMAVANGRFDGVRHKEFTLAGFKDGVRSSASSYVPVRCVVRYCGREHQLHLVHVYKTSANRNGKYTGEPISYLREGQSVFHPDYGVGRLEAFVNEFIHGDLIKLARFQFFRYEGVQFFIPSHRYLPLYNYRPTVTTNNLSFGVLR